jgi:hypothetical protein
MKLATLLLAAAAALAGCSPMPFDKYVAETRAQDGGTGKRIGFVYRDSLRSGAQIAATAHPYRDSSDGNGEEHGTWELRGIQGGRICFVTQTLGHRYETQAENDKADHSARENIFDFATYTITTYRGDPTDKAWPRSPKSAITDVRIDRGAREGNSSQWILTSLCGPAPEIADDAKLLVVSWTGLGDGAVMWEIGDRPTVTDARYSGSWTVVM